MNTCLHGLVVVGLLGLGQLPLPAGEIPQAKPEKVGLSSEKLQEVSARVRDLIKNKQVAGAITLVCRRGKIVHFEAHGVRDLATGKPMQTDTILRIYSMSKPITSVALMILWEEGKFQLDDPVSKYLPALKGVKVYVGGKAAGAKLVAAKRAMTVRDLMRHTSGLSYGFDRKKPVDQLYQKETVLDRNSTLEEMVAKLGKLPLVHQPGTRFKYSVSVDVQGRLIEVLSKQPLDEFFRKRIFELLDMRDTGFFVPEKKLGRFAATHGKDREGKLIVIDAPAKSRYRTNPRLFSGGGGLVSTARDYGIFCQMLVGGGQLHGKRILKASTVKLMTRNHLPKSAMPLSLGGKRVGVGFGLGFSVRVARNPKAPAGKVGEYGWGGAASTHFWISPGDEMFVLALQQFKPYRSILEDQLKPIVYDAILKK